IVEVQGKVPLSALVEALVIEHLEEESAARGEEPADGAEGLLEVGLFEEKGEGVAQDQRGTEAGPEHPVRLAEIAEPECQVRWRRRIFRIGDHGLRGVEASHPEALRGEVPRM